MENLSQTVIHYLRNKQTKDNNIDQAWHFCCFNGTPSGEVEDFHLGYLPAWTFLFQVSAAHEARIVDTHLQWPGCPVRSAAPWQGFLFWIMTSGGKLNYVHYTGKTKARDNESHQERPWSRWEGKGKWRKAPPRPTVPTTMSEVCLALLCGSEKPRLHLLGGWL